MSSSPGEHDARDSHARFVRQCIGEPVAGALWLTDNFPVGACVFYRDPETDQPRFGFFSNRLLTMLDLNRDELEADPMVADRNMHPEDVDAFWRHADTAAREGTAFNIDCRHLIRGEVR